MQMYRCLLLPTFDMEVENLHGKSFEVRWNCDCMVKECLGNNVIYLGADKHCEPILIKKFDHLPFTITREELYAQVEKLLLLL